MMRWTGFALWEFKILFPGSLTSTFLQRSLTLSSVEEGPSDAPVLTTLETTQDGYLAHKKPPFPLGPPGKGLLKVHRGKRFLMSEVQGLIEIKDTHRPQGGTMLLGIGLL